MKNNKIIILLISIIILQNIGLLINKQEKLKTMIRNTEMYINGIVGNIDDLINLDINDRSSVEDIEAFNQSISLCKYFMFLGDKTMDGYRINIDDELLTFYTYASEHSTILDEIAKDQKLEIAEKEFLELLKKEISDYSLELKKIKDKKIISIKDVNVITSRFDVANIPDKNEPFLYIERYEDFINNLK